VDILFSSLGGYSPSSAAAAGAGGGDRRGGIMTGHMECSCAREAKMKYGQCTENELYTTTNNDKQTIVLSYFQELGWHDSLYPLHGFYFTNCSETGTCHRTMEQTQLLVNRSNYFDFDWSQPFPEAINTSGVLRAGGDIGLPSQPAIAICNRGHWGLLSKERAKTIMPILYDWVNQDQNTTTMRNKKNGGRCFFKSTTASHNSEELSIFEKELLLVRPEAHDAGCEYLDYAHLTKLFGGFGNTKGWEARERGSVYWDALHYMPWVYEELNQVLLNVLCNSKKLSEEDDL
jgi:hypothetical protein